MKAFSPEMFTEQAQTSLKEDAYNLINQKPAIIRSLLEAEDDSIIMEMDARREMYISLLESQQQGLDIIDEAGLGGKMIAAIIAGIIAIIGALIAMLTGKGGGGSSSGGSSSSSSSSTSSQNTFKQLAATEKKTNDQIKSSSTYKALDKVLSDKEFEDFQQGLLDARADPSKTVHALSGKVTTKNALGADVDSNVDYSLQHAKEFNDKHAKNFPINFFTHWFVNDNNDIEVSTKYRITGKQFRNVARSMSPVDVIKYELPDKNICAGNVGSINVLISVCNDLSSAYNSISSNEVESAKSEFEKIKNKLDSASEDIKKVIDHETKLNEGKDPVPTNPGEYLDSELKHMDGLKHVHAGLWTVPAPVFDNVHSLKDLKKALEGLLKKANETEYEDSAKEIISSLNSSVKNLRATCIELSSGIAKCANTYDETLRAIARQVGKVDDAVKDQCIAFGNSHELAKFESAAFLKPFNLQESMMYGDSTYTESDLLQESAFANDLALNEDYTDYYQAIDDTSARFFIYMHENQMRAINEEALIFSETSISDYEKFQRLQAVNEALGAKIKRGWYNAVAAIKEVFRKFMEKLTANFTTTKNYLDRYKNIILKANFNPKDEYKTQDLDTSINRILNTEAPPFDFNDLVNAECNTPGEFFANVFSKKARLDRPINDQIKFPDANSTMGDINEYFKSYFCMEGHDKTYSGADFQRGINNYFNFLYDIRKINQTIKKSIDNIEDTATKIMKQAGVDVNKPADNAQNNANATGTSAAAPAANAGANATTQANNDSFVYSNLYQKYFTLNENGVLVEADINAGAKPQTPSQGMKNVADKAEGSDDTNAIKNTERSSVDSKVKAYVDVCTGMLRAKMSACEFTRNELMQIIRHHVQAHIGNAAANPQQNNQQQQQTQQQEQQPQQQQQAQAAKPTVGQRIRNAANAIRGR